MLKRFFKQKKDSLRPEFEPAASLYDAFVRASKNRKDVSVDQWIERERMAVFNAAKHIAEKMNLRCPTLEEVAKAESNAVGSSDYGAKWARGVAGAMLRSI